MVEPAVDLTHAHSHDDHEHHGPQGWKKYLWSTDHKVIAMQYMFTGMFMALVGGFMAYVFRMQLAFPGINVPGFGMVSMGEYNSLVTNHGTIMIFWVAMPVLLAAFGNFLIPLMVGADDMVFPKINRLSFQVFFVSTIVILASLVVEGGDSPAPGRPTRRSRRTRRTTSPRSGVPCGWSGWDWSSWPSSSGGSTSSPH